METYYRGESQSMPYNSNRPSAVSPFLIWKDITELLLLTPKTPSNPPVSYPSVVSASWAIQTYTPLHLWKANLCWVCF